MPYFRKPFVRGVAYYHFSFLIFIKIYLTFKMLNYSAFHLNFHPLEVPKPEKLYFCWLCFFLYAFLWEKKHTEKRPQNIYGMASVTVKLPIPWLFLSIRDPLSILDFPLNTSLPFKFSAFWVYSLQMRSGLKITLN